MNGRPGFFVVTPLQSGRRHAPCWCSAAGCRATARERTRVPRAATPAGTVRVEGRIAPPPARLYEFDSRGVGADPAESRSRRPTRARPGCALRPLSVVQDDGAATAADGLLRQWPPPAVDVHKHYGYAFQWFALSALITGLYVWFQLVRPRLRRRSTPEAAELHGAHRCPRPTCRPSSRRAARAAAG